MTRYGIKAKGINGDYMSTEKHYQSVRELELSKSLARLINTLPYGVVSALIEALVLESFSQDFESDIKYGVGTEVRVFEKTPRKTGRADVYIPISFEGSQIGGIVFETKLYHEDNHQLTDYASDSTKLIVSISRSIKNKKLEKSNPNIILLSWEDLFQCLLPLLSETSRSRLMKGYILSRKGRIQPDYPPFFIGVINDSILEYFLLDIREKGLLNIRPKHRLLVVSGEFASNVAVKHAIAGIGIGWDHQFSYYCVVHKKIIQYIGSVQSLFSRVNIDTDGAPTVEGIDLEKEDREKIVPFLADLKQWKEESGKSKNEEVALVILGALSTEDQYLFSSLGLTVGKVYPRRGAVTQSHRYFDSPEDFGSIFLDDNNTSS